MRRSFVAIAGSLILLSQQATCSSQDITWKRLAIDPVFRSEGVAAADVNRDGKMDVLAGDVWYAAPDWTMHPIRKVGEYHGDKGYSQSFANWAHDLDGDGWDDFIVIGFPGEPFHWYRNPQNQPGFWKEHVIWRSACNESPDFVDLNGDGRPEFVLGSQPEAKVGFLEIPSTDKVASQWSFRAISRSGNPMENGTFKYYHGLGTADLNNDGRKDVLIPHGWWEAPAQTRGDVWRFHEYRLAKTPHDKPLPAGDLHVDDLDLDGDNDIIMSSAHTFGIWWFENLSGNSANQFRYHLIDESFSQTHAMEYVDINGDGQRDIITGKRYFAHNGNDPGGMDPVVMYWYEVRRKRGSPPEFVPHEIVAGRDTGIGTQFLVRDFDGDSRPDVVLSNKKGVNVLLQRPRTGHETQ